jgi:hypothetical protein
VNDRVQLVVAYDALPTSDRAPFRAHQKVTVAQLSRWRIRHGIGRSCRKCGDPVDGRRHHCATCARVIAARSSRYRHVARRYGLSPEQYDRLVIAQAGRCAACGEPPPATGTPTQRYLHVDHDHDTGRVRGLLCHPCNLTLGYARDDPDRLRRLIDYLR